jgi:hypothetical protein
MDPWNGRQRQGQGADEEIIENAQPRAISNGRRGGSDVRKKMAMARVRVT